MAAKDLYEKDYYQILGVAKGADSAAIKKQYRKLARELHPDKTKGDKKLEDRFKAVADRINVIVEKLGLTKFADAPVPFNPEIHEALMHETSKDVTEPTASKILQPGYKFKDRVIRPARVAVTDPEATA